MIDQWLHKRRSGDYDCASFASEVLGVPKSAISGALSARAGWLRISGPSERALVLLRPKIGTTHVGIYTRGSVLHLGERTAMFQPLHIIKRDYPKMNFYARCGDNN